MSVAHGHGLTFVFNFFLSLSNNNLNSGYLTENKEICILFDISFFGNFRLYGSLCYFHFNLFQKELRSINGETPDGNIFGTRSNFWSQIIGKVAFLFRLLSRACFRLQCINFIFIYFMAEPSNITYHKRFV